MKKTVYLLESYMTYVNKGSLEIDLDYFPEFKDLTNEEIAQELANGEYFVSDFSNEIRPKSIDHLPESIKEEWINEDGEIDYSSQEMMTLWDCHREADVDFDKIKNEEHYFLVDG